MKILLYCVKAKPYLVKRNIFAGVEPSYFTLKENVEDRLNGKIVAECDFEVEKIEVSYEVDAYAIIKCFTTETIKRDIDFYTKSCLYGSQIDKYLKGKNGYAIHIKNLHIFDEPKSIQDYSKNENPYYYIENAPQNMMYAYDVKSFNNFEKKVLISIHPEWLCKILNGEKTIEVRRKVLKEMLDNE